MEVKRQLAKHLVKKKKKQTRIDHYKEVTQQPHEEQLQLYNKHMA